MSHQDERTTQHDWPEYEQTARNLEQTFERMQSGIVETVNEARVRRPINIPAREELYHPVLTPPSNMLGKAKLHVNQFWGTDIRRDVLPKRLLEGLWVYNPTADNTFAGNTNYILEQVYEDGDNIYNTVIRAIPTENEVIIATIHKSLNTKGQPPATITTKLYTAARAHRLETNLQQIPVPKLLYYLEFEHLKVLVDEFVPQDALVNAQITIDRALLDTGFAEAWGFEIELFDADNNQIKVVLNSKNEIETYVDGRLLAIPMSASTESVTL